MAPATENLAPAAKDPALLLERVTLRYRIPREVIVTFKEYALRKLQGRMEHNTLVAVRDVSLSIAPGERVGVIGPNGAGKSSLFRLIARVRRPTEGRLVVRGRVAPLLELGLGFHGDLTGRENIILQGTLLGFSRREMADRTPAIASCQVQAGPPNTLTQLVGSSRHRYQSRRSPEANQGCCSEVWLGTKSRISRRPSARASAASRSQSSRLPNSGSTSSWSDTS